MLNIQKMSVINAWIEVFQQLLLEIPFEGIKKDIISEIYSLSDVCSPIILKYSSMKMVAASLKVEINFIH